MHFSFGHLGASTVEIRGFQIPDEKAVGPEEQRVVAATGFA